MFSNLFDSFVKAVPWENGRQVINAGPSFYHKYCFLYSERFMCDGYLLYYPTGGEIRPHVDKVDFGRHYRLNIMLKKAKKGGEFICKDPIFRFWRIFFFRPDVSEHAVSKIEEGKRLMLSFGWIRK
jgi:hypothetical protein